MANKFQAGQIVWATVRDRNGFRKSRPVIIVTPDHELGDDKPIVVMAITTTYPNPAPKDCIELPWNPDPRRVKTGLARRSAAVMTWLATLYADEITSVIGIVPSSTMKTIRERLSTLHP